MRLRLRRLAPFAFVTLAWLAAWGCYSSEAAPPKVDERDAYADLPIEDARQTETCVPRKPWDGPGITGVVLPPGQNRALVINGDRYAVAELDVSPPDAGDPNLGRVLSWHESGLLKELWATAPAVNGSKPWEDRGVTAAYVEKDGSLVIISQFRRWVLRDEQWIQGSVVDDLTDGGKAPPFDADGGRPPWVGPGVTGVAFNPEKTLLEIVSQDQEWIRVVGAANRAEWVWLEGSPYRLANILPWKSAPAVNNQRPWEGPGVTAMFTVGSKLLAFSVDKMWATDRKNWVASGPVRDQQGWSSAPTVGCP